MDISEGTFVLEDIKEEAKIATFDLLPAKSKTKYDTEYKNFDSWRKARNVHGINEDVMLAYFHGFGNTQKASLLWTRYSKLKSTLKVYENVDKSRFMKVTAYLKGKNRIYTPKKAKKLQKEHNERFLNEAPDNKYLMMKVALIMGIKDKESYLLVTLPDTKTNKIRRFTVLRDGYTVNLLNLYKKYASLRPSAAGHRKFFLNYKKEKCTIQPVGINTLSRIPKDIAIYLNLPEPETYTGHSFRRSSATLLANTGGDLMTLKRHGDWISSSIAEGYVEDSVSNKINIANKIMRGETSGPIKTHPKPFNVNMSMFSLIENTLNEAVNCGQFGGIHFHGNIDTVNFFIKPSVEKGQDSLSPNEQDT